WGACGFRSGFMLHNLAWLHELDIKYDMSTFDTDPFEPQPEGHHTIFPFVVSRPQSHEGAFPHQGYVELPYTLPQDSTLFLLLRERNPEIWLRKTDWIAQHGGMALVNVHPDYVQLEGEAPSSRAYPVAHYRKFLEYVRDTYRNEFWQPLPRELADFVSHVRPLPIFHRPRRICMVTHSFYESDNRVTRYAQALASRGDHVDVFALRRSPELPEEEEIDGVKLVRIQDRFGKKERSKIAYLWPLLRFLWVAARQVRQGHARHRYDLLHVHNVPDFIVFSGWYPKLTGARIILDIHDIVPEFFASKFGKRPQGAAFTLLAWMERISAAFADHVIIANHLWIGKYSARTRTQGRCTPFINHVDSSIFTPRRFRRNDGKLIVLFPGGLQWHQGVDIAIRAFEKVSAELPNAEFHIYGDGSAKQGLVALTKELKLESKVRFFDTLDIREIASVMAQADLGVVPKRADSFGDEAYSTKIMEFMSVGVPVIVSSTTVDRHYFDESVVRFFESGNSDALARDMIAVLRDAEASRPMVERASRYAARNCWESRKGDYLQLVDALCSSSEIESVERVEAPAQVAA
ncbi:MAG: glycosyltransferase family 4 protein, partial [Acidobacteriota bacterium]|nr:glycosyltransferase family 4 protein [Acidobacteriota bacterium]